MRVLLIANNFDGFLDTALRAERAGHQVKVFARKYDPKTRPIGKGLVDLVDDWRPWMRWSELVLLEDNGVYMSEMDRWRREGCNIIGGNAESAALEINRTTGMQVFKKAGIPVPPYREFSDYKTAIGYVQRRDDLFVSKPCGAVEDKSLSYVANSPEDLVFMLRRWEKKHGPRPPCPFILQEKIDGIEFAAGAWFGPAGFAPGWEENFEHKKLMPGDRGPNTGEMGTVIRLVRHSKLAERVLSPLEGALAALGYVGNVDVNCIIDEGGTPWPLEFTMRFGWPAWNIESVLHKDPIEFLSLLAHSTPPQSLRALNTIACGVVMVIPPFPNDPKSYDDVVGIPLYGEAGDAWHPCEMMLDSRQSAAPTPSGGPRTNGDGRLASAGTYLGIATGTGETVRQATSGAYRTLKKLSAPASPFYRNDIGLKLKKMLPELQRHGYAKGMEY